LSATVVDPPYTARRAVVTLAATTLSNTLGILPVFLLGALAIFIRDELQFGETALGAAASMYYLAAPFRHQASFAVGQVESESRNGSAGVLRLRTFGDRC
jgi:hypothetical protein